jgi:hypothetical protein
VNDNGPAITHTKSSTGKKRKRKDLDAPSRLEMLLAGPSTIPAAVTPMANNVTSDFSSNSQLKSKKQRRKAAANGRASQKASGSKRPGVIPAFLPLDYGTPSDTPPPPPPVIVDNEIEEGEVLPDPPREPSLPPLPPFPPPPLPSLPEGRASPPAQVAELISPEVQNPQAQLNADWTVTSQYTPTYPPVPQYPYPFPLPVPFGFFPLPPLPMHISHFTPLQQNMSTSQTPSSGAPIPPTSVAQSAPPPPPSSSNGKIGLKYAGGSSSSRPAFQITELTTFVSDVSVAPFPYKPTTNRTIILSSLPPSCLNLTWVTQWSVQATDTMPLLCAIDPISAKALVEFSAAIVAKKAWDSPLLPPKGDAREDFIRASWISQLNVDKLRFAQALRKGIIPSSKPKQANSAATKTSASAQDHASNLDSVTASPSTATPPTIPGSDKLGISSSLIQSAAQRRAVPVPQTVIVPSAARDIQQVAESHGHKLPSKPVTTTSTTQEQVPSTAKSKKRKAEQAAQSHAPPPQKRLKSSEGDDIGALSRRMAIQRPVGESLKTIVDMAGSAHSKPSTARSENVDTAMDVAIEKKLGSSARHTDARPSPSILSISMVPSHPGTGDAKTLHTKPVTALGATPTLSPNSALSIDLPASSTGPDNSRIHTRDTYTLSPSQPPCPADPTGTVSEAHNLTKEEQLRQLVLASQRRRVKAQVPGGPIKIAEVRNASTLATVSTMANAVTPEARKVPHPQLSLDDMADSFLSETFDALKTYSTGSTPQFPHPEAAVTNLPATEPSTSTIKTQEQVGEKSRLQDLEEQIAEGKRLMNQFARAKTKEEKDRIREAMRRNSRCVRNSSCSSVSILCERGSG